MVEKPIYCMHCRHAFEYDTDKAKSDRFRYVVVCPECGHINKRLKEEYSIMLESAGLFLGTFLAFYFFFHSMFSHSIVFGLVWALIHALTAYYMRVVRFKRSNSSA